MIYRGVNKQAIKKAWKHWRRFEREQNSWTNGEIFF